MITRNYSAATIWDFSMACNPEIKENKNLQIGMLKISFDDSFEFDDVQIVGVSYGGFIVFDFLEHQPQANVSDRIGITRHFEQAPVS